MALSIESRDDKTDGPKLRIRFLSSLVRTEIMERNTEWLGIERSDEKSPVARKPMLLKSTACRKSQQCFSSLLTPKIHRRSPDHQNQG
jgi:hypothetical protein